MLSHLRQFSILNKIFNVKSNEWSKIAMSWVMSFLYRVGFVIGWTIIVALFVSRYGIASLPYLFVVNAVFTVIGSVFYSVLLSKFRLIVLMVANLFIAALILFVAYFFAQSDPILFFALLIVVEAIFLSQFRILLSGYIEEMFTPIQSERTFPLIEASETIGGIVAGLIITFLTGSFEVSTFILLWISLIILIVPVLIYYGSTFNKKQHKKEKATSIDIFDKVKGLVKDKNHFSFLKGLFVIVLFQWILFNLLEFQYTKAVYQNVSSVILQAGSGFEHAFFHDLGLLFILLSGSALVIQLFIGSRLINSLGVVGSMLLHPLVTLLSIFGLTFSYSYMTAVLAKNNFTITSVIHLNAYHSSYYAVREHLREYVREFLDGIVRPLGAIIGTGLLILLQAFLVDKSLIFYVNLLMLLVSLVLVYVTYRQQVKYTAVALEGVTKDNSREIRMNYIDILAQKGHLSSSGVLMDILNDDGEAVSIKVRALYAFSELEDLKAIPSIIKCLSSDSLEIRSAALRALSKYSVLFKNSNKYLVIEHQLVDALEKMFKKESRSDLQPRVLQFLSRLSTVSTFEFLVHALKSVRGKMKADVIYALGNYEDEDVTQFIKPYLRSKTRACKWAAVMALGKFDSYREEVVGIIASAFSADDEVDVPDAILAIGDLKIKSKKRLLLHYLKSENEILKINAAVSLAKMGYTESITVLVNLLFDGDNKVSRRVKLMISNVDVRIGKNLDKIVKQLASNKVNDLVVDHDESTLRKLSRKDLLTLKWLYNLTDSYEEVELLDHIIKT